MLKVISGTLDEVILQISKYYAYTSGYVKRMLDVMEYDVPYTVNSIPELLGLKFKETLRKNCIDPTLGLGVAKITLPEKSNSKNQRYIK